MAVGAGKFQLYSKIDPVLAAGDYRFVATQSVASSSTPVAPLHTHVRVRSPRYQLPPDQVLSTFPPAGSEGSYGSRLPQIVIKRRTLPWERDLAGQPSSTPWLALVLIAEGEGTLELNQPVEECVTPGITLPGVADSKLGGYLEVRRSVINRVFPTRKDVPLLAHAREVDINDTELMMGDDDGFLSVVIANRLPLAGAGPDGTEVPVKYLACLINLEGQFDVLLAESPPHIVFTTVPVYATTNVMTTAQYDQVKMGGSPIAQQLAGGSGVSAPRALAAGERFAHTAVTTTGAPPYAARTAWTLEQAESSATNIYAEMAADFGHAIVYEAEPIDPKFRFPVLLHWSFISSGDATFESLMVGLDSGLIGTVPEDRRAPEGRDPLEVVETGHVGLAHRTRRGDVVRSWYRGPIVPHPTPEADQDRLPLAHVADQLRVVIPDRREDVSLASAFEIGRLLALSRPSVVAAMMQWRQTRYHVERQRTIWQDHLDFLGEVYGDGDLGLVGAQLGVFLGRGLARKLAGAPDEFIGGPRPLIDPGRPIEFDDDPKQLIATGFGLSRDALSGDVAEILTELRRIDTLPGTGREVTLPTTGIRDALHRAVDIQLVDLVANSLDLRVPGVGGIVGGDGGGLDAVIVGPTVPGTVIDRDGLLPLAERLRARSAGLAGDIDVPAEEDDS
jgi:hypothetical protein